MRKKRTMKGAVSADKLSALYFFHFHSVQQEMVCSHVLHVLDQMPLRITSLIHAQSTDTYSR